MSHFKKMLKLFFQKSLFRLHSAFLSLECFFLKFFLSFSNRFLWKQTRKSEWERRRENGEKGSETVRERDVVVAKHQLPTDSHRNTRSSAAVVQEISSGVILLHQRLLPLLLLLQSDASVTILTTSLSSQSWRNTSSVCSAPRTHTPLYRLAPKTANWTVTVAVYRLHNNRTDAAAAADAGPSGSNDWACESLRLCAVPIIAAHPLWFSLHLQLLRVT